MNLKEKTMSILAAERPQTISPTQAATQEAKELLKKIQDSQELSISLQVSGAGAEQIGPELVQALRAVIAIIGSGQKVEISSTPQDLTTTVAAKRIGVSRPTLMKLIREGKIPAHKVGSHFRVRTEDADAYRLALLKHQTAIQEKAFKELRDLELTIGSTKAE